MKSHMAGQGSILALLLIKPVSWHTRTTQYSAEKYRVILLVKVILALLLMKPVSLQTWPALLLTMLLLRDDLMLLAKAVSLHYC